MTKEEIAQEVKRQWEAEAERINTLYNSWKVVYPNVMSVISRDSFDVPLGWVGHVGNLFSVLEEGEIAIRQVKEKLGSLRLYLDDVESYNKILPQAFSFLPCSEVISAFEIISAYICERCGSSGKLNTEKNYIQTLCYTCVEVRESTYNTYYR